MRERLGRAGPGQAGLGRAGLGRAAVAEFLDLACDRHGGLEIYELTPKLSLRLLDVGGPVPWWKGLGRRFPVPRAVDVWPHARRVVFYDYPQPGHVAIYDDGRVALGLDPHDRLTGPTHRDTFVGIAKWRTWWPEDAVYFLGYALLLYVSLPFCLFAQQLISARRGNGGVELWYRFADSVDTHSDVQGFYFDESGLLLRHDYRVDILGAVFNGAHVSSEYREIAGLQVATRRTVYAKPWHYPVRARLPIVVLEARLDERPADPPAERPADDHSKGGPGGDGSAPVPAVPRGPTGPRTSASRSYADS
jgi:hypothetical protein